MQQKEQVKRQKQIQEHSLQESSTLSQQKTEIQNSEYLQMEQKHKNDKKYPQYSLFTHPKIAAQFRYGIPILLLLNIALFLDANVNPGATVSAFVKVGLFQSKNVDIKTFTLVESVVDMWRAGVYPISILIGILSGIWPYAKLIMMLICWMLKESVLSYKHRETMLVILDAAGKWALVDSFVLVIMVVSFRYELEKHLVVGEQFNIIVNPGWGYYGYVLAAVVSLIVTHIILHQHRKLKKIKVFEEQPTKSLGSENKKVYYTVIGLIIISFTLLIAGSIVDTFTFHFYGLAGAILPKNQQSKSYSIISLGMALPSSMPDPNSFGSRYIQVIFILISFVMPILFLVFLLILYIKPIKIQVQQKLFVATEIIYAWSAMDVMIVSLVASTVEIKQFVAFMLGHNCDGLNQAIKLINDTPAIDIHVDPPVCYQVIVEFGTGSILLFISSFVFFLLGSITLRKLKKRLDKLKEELQTQQIRDKQNSQMESPLQFDQDEEQNGLQNNQQLNSRSTSKQNNDEKSIPLLES